MRALWRLASTAVAGDPCLVVLLANHRGLGSKQVSGYGRRLLVCRLSGLSPYVGGSCGKTTDVGESVRATVKTRAAATRKRATSTASLRFLEEGPGARTRTLRQRRRGVSVVMAIPPLRRFRAANRRMHQSQGVHAFFVFFQL